MKLQDESQLSNTHVKLQSLEEQIAKARQRPSTPERNVSIQSLVEMANQLRQEIMEYEKAHQVV